MRILLTTRREINETRNPIAILDLASYWRQQGHRVDIYYLDQLEKQGVETRRYDMVGLSVLQTLRENIPIRDAWFLQKKFKTNVVVGGKWTHTLTGAQEDALKGRGIEICKGPGEHHFGSREIDFSTYPSWNADDFHTLRYAHSDVMTTRGCPYHCYFCHNTETNISFFSAKRSADQVELLLRLGVKNISFIDDIFTLKAAHLEGLYGELKKRRIDIEHRNEFFTHIHHIREETIQWIKAYQPYHISVGIESGDDGMLLRMGKGFDSQTAFEKIRWLHEETKNSIGALYIIGFPGETEESLRNTLNFIQRIRPFAGSWVSYYQPVRGTRGYEMALERRKRLKLGRRNTGILYVDPNMTKKLLFKYHYQMMDFSPTHSMRRRLIYALIDLLPYWFFALLRRYRQNKRLKEDMDRAYLLSEETASAG